MANDDSQRDITVVLSTAKRDAAEEDADILPPDHPIGGYLVVRQIATGGCGSVYEAEHGVLGRRVAIKVLSRQLSESGEMVERFIREAQAVNLIHHPNVVDIFEFGYLRDGRPYHVMELLDGVGLDAFVRERGRLTLTETVELVEPICSALQAAHERHIVHRDLTPGNVVVSSASGKRSVKLVDFGIAKLLEGARGAGGFTVVGRKLGTPVSMAPEQIRGRDVTHLTDIYALGVLIYYCLTGAFPFECADIGELERHHLTSPPPPPSKEAAVSPAVDTIVARCMAKDPQARYETASQVLAALRAVLAPRGSSPDNSLRTTSAVAVYLEVQTELDGSAEDEFAALEDAAAVLDLSEATLARAGYHMPLKGGNALLAVRVLPDDPSEHEREKLAAIDLARDLAREIAARAGAVAANKPSLSVHADAALEKIDASGKVTLAGPILRVRAWASNEVVPAIHITTGARQAAVG